MAYIALYRKYRSQSFDEVKGQEQVTRTLQNALKSGRIGHAYLFYGARGCGKTSTARLLARALNCAAQDGPTATPCGVCRLCTAIRDGSCMDVIEMDAASETGIDDVREKIIENVQYAPGEARYKVYIIDEVHDLSAKAFDALLKTLEEPPGHVVFILATTELHKVPITIRSRCTQFAFMRGSVQDLSAAVERVLLAESYTAEPEAIQSIARSAEGSWRDALSLLEQVLAYSDGHVTAEAVHRALGTVGTTTLAHVTETLARGEWDATLEVAAELIDSGKDVRQLLTALSGHLRDLILIAAGARQAAAKELGPDRLSLLMPQAGLFDPPTLLEMMSVLSEAEREVRFTNQHRWILEKTLLRLMPGNLKRGAKEPIAPVAAASHRATAQNVPLAALPSVIARPAASAVSFAAEVEESDEADERDTIASLPPAAHFAPEAMDAPIRATVLELNASLTATIPTAAQNGHTDADPAPDGTYAHGTNEHRFAPSVTLDVIKRAWPRILKDFAKQSPAGIAFLQKAEVVALEGKTLVLHFTDQFARDRIEKLGKGRETVEKCINMGLDSKGFKIRCVLVTEGEQNGVSPVIAEPRQEIGPLLDMPRTVVTGPGSVMDFEVPTALPPPASQAQPEEAVTATPIAPPTIERPKEQAPDDRFLEEILDMFGGEVVRSEPFP